MKSFDFIVIGVRHPEHFITRIGDYIQRILKACRTTCTVTVAKLEQALADDGAVLVGAVVVAGDGAGADVDVTTDHGVPEVTEVTGLAPFAQGGILGDKATGLVMGLLLALYAFGIGKAGIMPGHFWLPAAMLPSRRSFATAWS